MLCRLASTRQVTVRRLGPAPWPRSPGEENNFKVLATLDVLSNGRLTLEVGVGWMEEEFVARSLVSGSFNDQDLTFLGGTVKGGKKLYRRGGVKLYHRTLSYDRKWCMERMREVAYPAG